MDSAELFEMWHLVVRADKIHRYPLLARFTIPDTDDPADEGYEGDISRVEFHQLPNNTIHLPGIYTVQISLKSLRDARFKDYTDRS